MCLPGLYSVKRNTGLCRTYELISYFDQTCVPDHCPHLISGAFHKALCLLADFFRNFKVNQALKDIPGEGRM